MKGAGEQVVKVVTLAFAIAALAIMVRNSGGVAQVANATIGEAFRTAASLARS